MIEKKSYYSEEVTEIMEKLPSWGVRWGMLTIFLIFSGIFLGTFFIKIPKTLSTSVVLTTNIPPVEIIALTTGEIDSLFCSNNHVLEKGMPVAYIANTAEYTAVMMLERHLKDTYLQSVDRIPFVWKYDILPDCLGVDMQDEYCLFCTICNRMKICIQVDPSFKCSQKFYECEKDIIASRKRLMDKIRKWKNQYVLIAPERGTLFFENKQKLKTGECFAVIIPDGPRYIEGILKLSFSDLVYFHERQPMYIKLENGSDVKSEIIEGVIESIFPVSMEDSCQVRIRFSQDILPEYKMRLRYVEQIKIKGKIVYKKERLINKLINY